MAMSMKMRYNPNNLDLLRIHVNNVQRKFLPGSWSGLRCGGLETPQSTVSPPAVRWNWSWASTGSNKLGEMQCNTVQVPSLASVSIYILFVYPQVEMELKFHSFNAGQAGTTEG
jgi:hypothetical protein